MAAYQTTGSRAAASARGRWKRSLQVLAERPESIEQAVNGFLKVKDLRS